MGIYSQLNRLAVRFPVKKSFVDVPAASSIKLVDNSNARIYLAFTYLTTATPITFSPFPNPISGDGYPTQGNSQIFELWIEKHKSLVSNAWYAFNTVAGIVRVTIIEVVYSDIEEENAQRLND